MPSLPDKLPPAGVLDWLRQTMPLPGRRNASVDSAARHLAPYYDPEATARQAAADNTVLDLFRGTTGHVDFMSVSGLFWLGANFDRTLDGKPIVHHLIDRRDLLSLIMLVSGQTEDAPIASPYDTDMEGRNAHDYATALGWDEGVKYLEAYGHNPSREPRVANNHQIRMDKIVRRSLDAINEDMTPVLRAALMLGANPDLMVRPDLSAFQQAVVQLKAPMAQAFLDAGARLDGNARGQTLLQILWWCHAPKPLSDDWYAMARLLRAAGADTADFKLPEEMSDAELIQPVPGAPAGKRCIDFALVAGRYDLYHRGLLQFGDGLVNELTSENNAQRQPPLNALWFQDRLDVAFNPGLWEGRPQAMHRAWAAVADLVQKPNRLRDDKLCSFTATEFGHVYTEVVQGVMAARAAKQLKLKGPRG